MQVIRKGYKPSFKSWMIKSAQLDFVGVDQPVENAWAERIASLKDHLCQTKSKQDTFGLGSKDPKYSDFNGIHMILDIFKPLRFRLMDEFKCQLVTNAWMKYYEIYARLDIKDKDLRVFCNAELPGASICALNHILKTSHINYEWLASSLMPSDDEQDSLGDYYGVYACNKSNWTMSAQNNGDMTSIANILDLEGRFGQTIHIYSSDAGMDVSGRDPVTNESLYNRQEQMDMRLHLGCALAGFLLLRPGGSIVLKQYTFFEPLSAELIAIYATLFETFRICKPATSRPYNSEIYLVGQGFKGLGADLRQILTDRLVNWKEDPILPAIPGETLNQLQAAAVGIFETQIRFIEENLRIYQNFAGNKFGLKKRLTGLKNYSSDAWIKTNGVRSIKSGDYIKTTKVRDLRR